MSRPSSATVDASESETELDLSFDEGYVEDIVRLYLRSIGKVPLLNKEQEIFHAKRIEAGLFAGKVIAGAAETSRPLDARRQRDLKIIKQEGAESEVALFEANLRLVVSLAKRYQNQGLPLLDLIQEGNFGLRRAVEKFDYTKGFKFSTYATTWIRKAVADGIADTGAIIRIPIKVHEQVNKLRRLQGELAKELDHDPTFPELAAKMGCGVDRVEELLGYAKVTHSLSEEISSSSTQTLEDKLPHSRLGVEAEVMRNFELQELKIALKYVASAQGGDRLAYVLNARWGLDGHGEKTLDVVGEELGGLSRERVRQIETRALKLLKVAFNGMGYDLDPTIRPSHK